jgi:predicted metal-dependent hydrolase
MSPAGARAPHLRGQSVKGLQDRTPHRYRIRDETLIVRVRESTRARTARIIVGPRRPLEVIVPRGTSDRQVGEFLEEKRRWIERKVAAAREIAERQPRLGLIRPGVVWLECEAVPIEQRNGRRPIARMSDGRLVVAGPAAGAAAAIERWYRREARRRIETVVRREAERLGLEYKAIGIRDPRTRWGSCSRNANLSFSWRLAAAPLAVLEYVVVHELCHLREPSHQKPFWQLLGAVRPGWQEQARWLREHGQELHDYDPGAAFCLAE